MGWEAWQDTNAYSLRSRAKGSNSQAALSIVKNGPPWVNCVTLTQLGARASAESNPGGGSQPRFC